MTDFTFNQLVNIQQVHNLLESHHALSGMAYGVLDTEENTLVAVGWQDLCVRFHRVNPVSCEYCRESDAYIKAHLHDLDGDFIEYRCKNGLTDVAIPILIEGRHVATFYAGQFFFDDNRPDTEFFSRQAVALGFDQEEYLESLERVPVFSREFVRTTVVFLRDMVNVLSETGLINLERAKNVAETQRLLHELQVHQLEPEMQNEELFQSREKLEFTLEKYTDLYDFAPVSYVTLNHNGIISDVNLAGASLLGGERSKLIGRRFVQFVATADRPEFTTFIGMVYCSRKKEAIEIVLQSEGTIQFIVQIDAMAAASGQECRLALTNITERKRAEQELRKAFDFSEGVINAIPDLLFEIDRNGRYLNVWTQKTELLAAQKEFLLGKTVHDVLSPESAAIVIDSIREAEENGLSFGKVLRIDLTLGMRWFELSVSRKPGGGAAYASFIVLSRDITERKQIEAALRESEQQFRTLTENSPDIITRYDRECRRVYVNPTYARETGIPVELAQNAALDKKWPADMNIPVKEYESKLRQVMETGVPAEILLEWPRQDSKQVSSHVFNVVAERDAADAIIGCLAIGHNISGRKEAEFRLARLAETSPGIMFTFLLKPDGTSCMPYVSARIEEVNGLRPEDMAEDMTEAYARIHPDDMNGVRESIANSANILSSWHCEFRIRHPAKGDVWVEGRATPEPQPNGGILWSGFFHNITERKHTEDILRVKQEQLASMAIDLSLAEERERRRIASELHDHVGQQLLLSKIKLDSLSGVFRNVNYKNTYNEIHDLIARTIKDLRSLTQQLNPPLLGSVGLEAALEWLSQKMESDYSLQVDFADDGSPKSLDEDFRSIVFQSARELLINVAKHARTGKARLSTGRKADMFMLMVEDQGVGFACLPGSDTNIPLNSSFGLFNIRQRIKHLGGELLIQSAAGCGTRATIHVPLTDY